jgi:hypothetical protein
MRTLGAQLRKLPELKKHSPSLRVRGDVLYVLIDHDGEYWLSETPWIKLDTGPDASDLEILSSVSRCIEQWRKEQAELRLPVATGSMVSIRRKALQEIEGLRLTTRVTEARGRHLDALIAWLEERGLGVEADHLLAYLREIPQTSRARRDGETAARLLLRVAKGKELQIPKSEKWRRPPPKKNQPLDGPAVITVILKLVELDPEIGWLTAMVALTGARGAMVMSCELLHHPIPVEIGHYIRCRDDKRGRSREANLCPSWKQLLVALPEGFIDHPPAGVKEVARPWNQAPSQEQQLACEKRMVYWSNKTRRLLTAEERQLVDFRQLRHHRAHALLDSSMDVLRVAEVLSTSADMLQKVYADHHKFRAADDIKKLFG